MSYILVELEGVLATPQGKERTTEAVRQYRVKEEVIELINNLSDKYDIVVFSSVKEEHRLAVEDFVSTHNIMSDDVVLGCDHVFGASHVVCMKAIKTFFDNDEDKMFLKTHSVFTNNDKLSEILIDEEYTVFNVG